MSDVPNDEGTAEGGFKMPGMPMTFEDFSEKVVANLSPVEQISPFKVGQIQKLIADADEQLGKTLAPYFAILQVCQSKRTSNLVTRLHAQGVRCIISFCAASNILFPMPVGVGLCRCSFCWDSLLILW